MEMRYVRADEETENLCSSVSTKAESSETYVCMNTPGPQSSVLRAFESHPGSEPAGRQSYRLAAVCLGMLCLLLLLFTTVISVYYKGALHEGKASMLKAEREETNYSTLMTERDQLQANYSTLKAEGNQLQANYDTLETERDQLQANYTILRTERDQLQANYSTLKAEGDQLQANYSTLETERDQLQANYTILRTEGDQLQANYNTLKTQRDQLQANYSTLRTDRDQLQVSYGTMAVKFSQLEEKVRHAQEHRCPVGWNSFNSKCYYISDKKSSWVDSQKDCRQRGADLVVIDSNEEQIFISQFRRAWIGLADREHEGNWKWVDGTQITISYWAAGEPNDTGKDEDCAEVYTEHESVKNWNDKSCSAKLNWICERGGS